MDYMELALDLARQAIQLDEVPVGAVVVLEGAKPEIVAVAHNERESKANPVGHAELLAIARASEKLGRWRLNGCTLYVTLEPCVMCAGAIVLSRLDKVVYGATDPKAGAVSSLYEILKDTRLNHQPEVISGVKEPECSRLLKEFFSKKRKEKL
jgi:tRNA(adenine34) deaminase